MPAPKQLDGTNHEKENSLKYANLTPKDRSIRAKMRRRMRQQAKANHKEKRQLLKEINLLLPLAVQAERRKSNFHDLPDHDYKRWSSRKLPGKLWRLGRVSSVKRWEMPRPTGSSPSYNVRRFYLTSNQKLILPKYDMLYRSKRASKEASNEELHSLKAGLQHMIDTSRPTSSNS